MLRRDVTLEDFAHHDWLRLMSLWGLYGDHRAKPRQGVVALTVRGKLRKLLGTGGRRLDPKRQAWPLPLSELARTHDASWAVHLSDDVLGELMDRFARRLVPEQDATEQIIEFLRVVRELEGEGRLAAWPRPVSSIPLVGDAVLERSLDLVCPDGKAILFGAFHEGQIFTSVALQRRERGFRRVVGPEQLRRDVGLWSGDWRRDCHRLARAAELAVGPLAVGCFAEVITWRGLLRGHAPGAWATAVATREMLLHPLGPAVAVPLGVDVGRVAYHAMRGIAQRFGEGAGSALGPALGRVRAAIGSYDLGDGASARLRALWDMLDRDSES